MFHHTQTRDSSAICMRSLCTGSQPAERRFACGGIDIHLEEYVLYILAGHLTYSRYEGYAQDQML